MAMNGVKNLKGAQATPQFHFTNHHLFAILTEKKLMKKSSTSMVKPLKIKNLHVQRAVFIPADTPKKTIKSHLEKKAVTKQKFLFSHLYSFKNKLVLLGGIGAPAAVLAVEPLLFSGVKELIILGFCGGLTENIHLFDTYLINTALSEEGTSPKYIPEKKEFSSSHKLSLEIKQKLKSNHIDCGTASLVSTDAPYRETKKWLSHQVKTGIKLVDMETSALFALAEYYRIEAAAVMIVSDIIRSGSHKIGFAKTNFQDQVKNTFFLLL